MFARIASQQNRGLMKNSTLSYRSSLYLACFLAAGTQAQALEIPAFLPQTAKCEIEIVMVNADTGEQQTATASTSVAKAVWTTGNLVRAITFQSAIEGNGSPAYANIGKDQFTVLSRHENGKLLSTKGLYESYRIPDSQIPEGQHSLEKYSSKFTYTDANHWTETRFLPNGTIAPGSPTTVETEDLGEGQTSSRAMRTENNVPADQGEKIVSMETKCVTKKQTEDSMQELFPKGFLGLVNQYNGLNKKALKAQEDVTACKASNGDCGKANTALNTALSVLDAAWANLVHADKLRGDVPGADSAPTENSASN